MSDAFDVIPATPAALRRAADALRLDADAYRRAVELAAAAPDRAAWRAGIDRFLLALGLACLLAGIAAFFAWNWADMHRLAKLGLVEIAIVATVAVAAWRGIDDAAGRGALFAAAFLVGTLYAVYGQSYQTGADTHGLFVAWGVSIAAWVAIGRQPALWMLLLVVANLGLILYWTQVLEPELFGALGGLFGPLLAIGGALIDGGLATIVFALNAVALVIWELGAARGIGWMRVRWWPRAVAFLALVVVVSGTIFYVFGIDFSDRDAWFVLSGPVLFAVFAAASLWYYRFRCLDLFMLTVTLAGGIVCVTATVGRLLLPQSDAGGLLLLALLVVAQTTGAAVWVRRVAIESQAQ